MLTGKSLAKAIKVAIDRKIKSGAIDHVIDVARHFGISAPSVAGWTKTGSIGKEKLPELFRYFSDVCEPEHWGLSTSSPLICNDERPIYASKRLTEIDEDLLHEIQHMEETKKKQLLDFARFLNQSGVTIDRKATTKDPESR